MDLFKICIFCSFIENDDPKTNILRAKCPSNKKEGKRGVNHKWSSSSMEAICFLKIDRYL
jgi:hypothetical protein